MVIYFYFQLTISGMTYIPQKALFNWINHNLREEFQAKGNHSRLNTSQHTSWSLCEDH
jgi:hypothetical protein